MVKTVFFATANNLLQNPSKSEMEKAVADIIGSKNIPIYTKTKEQKENTLIAIAIDSSSLELAWDRLRPLEKNE